MHQLHQLWKSQRVCGRCKQVMQTHEDRQRPRAFQHWDTWLDKYLVVADSKVETIMNGKESNHHLSKNMQENAKVFTKMQQCPIVSYHQSRHCRLTDTTFGLLCRAASERLLCTKPSRCVAFKRAKTVQQGSVPFDMADMAFGTGAMDGLCKSRELTYPSIIRSYQIIPTMYFSDIAQWIWKILFFTTAVGSLGFNMVQSLQRGFVLAWMAGGLCSASTLRKQHQQIEAQIYSCDLTIWIYLRRLKYTSGSNCSPTFPCNFCKAMHLSTGLK